MALSIGTQTPNESWRGRIDEVAIHRAALAEQQIAASARRILNREANVKPLSRLVVEAKLVQASKIPQPKETVYVRSYSFFEYEVAKVLAGDFAGKKMRVAHWTEMDNRKLTPAEYKAGRTQTLTLEPFEEHIELRDEEVFDTLPEDFDVPLFFDAAPLAFAE
jgi:hypothetical protein